jgi:hypothetical protein
LLSDVYRFSPAANTWTALSPSGTGPSRRYAIGFSATPDGMLYVYGGYDDYYGGTEGLILLRDQVCRIECTKWFVEYKDSPGYGVVCRTSERSREPSRLETAICFIAGRCGGHWAVWGWLRGWTQSCGVHALHRR